MTTKRSVSIRGHRTSISIETAFWDEFRAIAAREDRALAALIAEIDATRQDDANLSSAIRLFVLADLRRRITALDGSATLSQAAGPL